MKRFITVIMAVSLLCLASCSSDKNTKKDKNSSGDTDVQQEACVVKGTKDDVSDFMADLDKVKDDLDVKEEFDEKNCYNLTSDLMYEETGIRIFKFSDSCASFAYANGGIHPICNYVGGSGFINAVPWDYDEDGNEDLLVASSCGSGVSRSEISLYNVSTGGYSVIVSSQDIEGLDDSSVLIVALRNTFLKGSPEAVDIYNVYEAKLEQDTSGVDISFEPVKVVGNIVCEDGMVKFEPKK
ncbi:hypothetical protein [Ruminococcus sp.]|uniref:hypothetical protein n=1 Tax=Ruminococcus sp. TaxID=41978 RepID=UPI0025D98FB5|nr:hypothetical protein [Ruminococcus sp.]MBQ8967618.1 hypothetical protein [Ruminococcus sp.]